MVGGREGGTGLGISSVGHHRGCQTTTLSSRESALTRGQPPGKTGVCPTEEIPRPSARRPANGREKSQITARQSRQDKNNNPQPLL